jgi:hypothetical protein
MFVRTSWNIAVQCGALAFTLLLRIANPGWMLAGLISGIVPLLALVTPLALALVTKRRTRLDWSVGALFLASAVVMILGAAFGADSDDRHDWIPLIALFAPQAKLDSDTMMGLGQLGQWALLGYQSCAIALPMVVVATRRPGPRSRRSRLAGESGEPAV